MANKLLSASDVAVCTVVSFPHGNSTVEVKLYEAQQALDGGAEEIDFVINQAAVAEAAWKVVQNEISKLNQLCLQNGAILKVIFENDFINSDKTIVRLCRICSDIEVAYVKSSTGFGFKKNETGFYHYNGAIKNQIQLMLDNVRSAVKVKASGGIRDFITAEMYLNMGVARLGTSSTAKILAEAKKREKDRP
jgi:deoxyribose-phosphate aldolase